MYKGNLFKSLYLCTVKTNNQKYEKDTYNIIHSSDYGNNYKCSAPY